jgi:hypothetical protein
MLTPLCTGHVIAGIEHVLAAGLTKSPGVVLKELDLRAAVHTGDLINVVQLPITQILSGQCISAMVAAPYTVLVASAELPIGSQALLCVESPAFPLFVLAGWSQSEHDQRLREMTYGTRGC